MKFNILYWYEEKFLPSKRHRKLRSRAVASSVEISIPELTE